MKEGAAAEIAALWSMSATELQVMYEQLTGEKTVSANRPYLMRRIAWHIQEAAHGGLSDDTHRRLKSIAGESDPLERFGARKHASTSRMTSRRRDRRLPAPGTVLTRPYRGRVISVTILEKGFEFEGKVHRSLSAIADLVTGAHWNGYVFFNL